MNGSTGSYRSAGPKRVAKAFRYTRAELQAMTPESYRLWRHVALIVTFTVLGVALAVSRIEDPGIVDALWFGGALLLTNFGEWAAHKTTLHHPIFPKMVHHRHIVEHHAFFSYDDMAVDTWRDLRWVLFPWWALPLLVATIAPIAFLLHWIGPPNAPWILVLAAITYYGIYELFHALAHLPDDAPFARNPIVRSVTHHHRVHHDPRLMQKWNFNFAIPLFDWLFGTLYREAGPPNP